jgi:hypothetical protein
MKRIESNGLSTERKARLTPPSIEHTVGESAESPIVVGVKRHSPLKRPFPVFASVGMGSP